MDFVFATSLQVLVLTPGYWREEATSSSGGETHQQVQAVTLRVFMSNGGISAYKNGLSVLER